MICWEKCLFLQIENYMNMKVSTYCLFSLFVAMMCLPAWAGENKIFVEKTTLKAGNADSLVVILENQDEVNGIQFDIQLPEGVEIDNSNERRAQATERLKGMSLMCRQLAPGVYRLLAFSMRGKTVQGNAGAIVVLPVLVKDDLVKGEKEVMLQKASLSVIKGEKKSAHQSVDDSTSILIVE